MDTKPTNKTSAAFDVDLHHEGEGTVRIYPKPDYDNFILSQREAVTMLNEQQQQIETAHKIKEMISDLFLDLFVWGKGQERVVRIDWTRRQDDALITVIASDEDEDCTLHDAMAQLDLAVFNKFKRFRINFMLFRASEADGIDAFVDLGERGNIYPSAKRSSTS